MRRSTLPTAALALLLAAGTAGAESNLDRAFGTPESGLDARSLAMGGAGSALDLGVFALVQNPASLALTRGSRVQLSGALARASENRFVPLFDTFDSFVDEAAIAVNDHVYGGLEGGVVADDPRLRGVVLALGQFARYDPRYDYFDERRTTATTDQIVAERTITTRGVLRSTSFGGAARLPWATAFGVAFNWYDGRIRHRDALVSRVSGVSGRIEEIERKLSGPSVTVGVQAHLDPRLDAGVSFESGARLEDEYATSVDDSLTSAPGASRHVHLPPRVQIGAVYRPRNTLRTTFAVDAVWTGWSNVRDALDPTRPLLDTWDVRVGLEHVYYNDLPGRIGFRYQRSWETREADRASFTLGIGYRVAPTRIDLAAEVGKRTSWQDPVWPRDQQGAAVGAGRDRVEDTFVHLTLGMEVGF